MRGLDHDVIRLQPAVPSVGSLPQANKAALVPMPKETGGGFSKMLGREYKDTELQCSCLGILWGPLCLVQVGG